MRICILHPFQKKKYGRKDGLGTWVWQSVGVLILWTSDGGMPFSQAFRNEASHRQDLLSHLSELGNVPDGWHP
jgi:hypothetical protein